MKHVDVVELKGKGVLYSLQLLFPLTTARSVLFRFYFRNSIKLATFFYICG